MDSENNHIVKDVVLVGGGHSHVAVLKSFGMKPMPGVRLTLIGKDLNTPYSGMLPGLIAGHYTFEEAHIDLQPLANFAGAQLYHDAVTRIDLENRKVHCASRPPVHFDILSINTGSTPGMASVPGAIQHSIPVKPIENFLEKWQEIQDAQSEREKPLKFVTVGAGAGGVELTMAVQFALQKLGGQEHNYTIVTKTDTILPTHGSSVQRTYEKILKERGVDLQTGVAVEKVDTHELVLDGGRTLEFDYLFWVTNASPADWPEKSGLKTDRQGFIAINDRLQSESHPYVFATGDVASCAKHPRPKSGVFAVRQGQPLSQNIRLMCAGQKLEPFRPQSKFLSLISTGDQSAVASYGPFSLKGDYIWKWKDWIDRRWMRRYQEMPEMETPEPKATKMTVPELLKAPVMHCGGCGSKVGSTTLSRVIRKLKPIKREDVLIGLDSPDDAAVTSTPPGFVGVHTIDFFRSFINDPYVFGQIASNHALSDVFAMGAEAQSALAMATVPYGDEENVEEQLYQVMAGALVILNDCNCALAGGHTTMGHEMAFGLSVHGIAERAKLMQKGGMSEGELLVLTKPIGTGTLFAADMRNQAKGVWVDAAVQSMTLSNFQAGQILHSHGATACTDVTGFGLLGHLVEMLKASGMAARVDLDRLPILPGALECMEAGIFSSLQPDNVRLRRGVEAAESVSERSDYPILFDPQTSGGLLASVPKDRLEPCLAELSEKYQATCVIGEVEAGGRLGEDKYVEVTCGNSPG